MKTTYNNLRGEQGACDADTPAETVMYKEKLDSNHYLFEGDLVYHIPTNAWGKVVDYWQGLQQIDVQWDDWDDGDIQEFRKSDIDAGIIKVYRIGK